jgi:uncharacterized cupin superfamily protein
VSEPVAAAVIDFLTTAMIENPRRVGKPLRGELAGIWSARRGTYRVLYRVREDRREVVVVRIEPPPGGLPTPLTTSWLIPADGGIPQRTANASSSQGSFRAAWLRCSPGQASLSAERHGATMRV